MGKSVEKTFQRRGLEVKTLFSVQLALGCGLACAALLLHRRYSAAWHSTGTVEDAALSRYEPAVAATLLWMLCYYLFLLHQSYTVVPVRQALKLLAKKTQEKPPSHGNVKYGKAGGVHVLRAERTVGNMVEQSLPFLVSLWLHAVYADPSSAARLAAIWLGLRGCYPLLFGRMYFHFPLHLIVTFPNYVVIAAMVWPLVGKVF